MNKKHWDYLCNIEVLKMRPKRIILVRHGQSQGNVDHNIYATVPDYEVELTSLGKQQAIDAGSKVAWMTKSESIHVYVSPYTRTRQTLKFMKDGGIAKHIANVVEDPRIREQDFGHLGVPENRAELIAERDRYGTFYYRMPDGESGADVFDRVSTFLETMHRDFEKENFPQNALIVTHGLTLRLFLMRWFHMTVEQYECLKNPHNCQIVLMGRNTQDKKFTLIRGLDTYPEPRHVALRRNK